MNSPTTQPITTPAANKNSEVMWDRSSWIKLITTVVFALIPTLILLLAAVSRQLVFTQLFAISGRYHNLKENYKYEIDPMRLFVVLFVAHICLIVTAKFVRVMMNDNSVLKNELLGNLGMALLVAAFYFLLVENAGNFVNFGGKGYPTGLFPLDVLVWFAVVSMLRFAGNMLRTKAGVAA